MKFKEEDRAALRRYYSLNFKRTLFRKQDAVVINGLLDDIDELLQPAPKTWDIPQQEGDDTCGACGGSRRDD